ncbi:hypothetical protein ACE6H2_007828 [Prunus campanulata]
MMYWKKSSLFVHNFSGIRAQIAILFIQCRSSFTNIFFYEKSVASYICASQVLPLPLLEKTFVK